MARNQEFSREVRLGLVLYGGVSLAIYMSGTTNEFFRAVRGRGVYWIIKHLLDADIGVDVVSGTSAGGINGIFLAFALANDREFDTCAELWREGGDLDTLLRELPRGRAEIPSVLDSDHYQELLAGGLEKMWELTPLPGAEHECRSPSPAPVSAKIPDAARRTSRREPDDATPKSDATPPPLERVTPTRELDLFVTGTNFYGVLSEELDSTGTQIDIKQHRTTFLLKHREGRKVQFDPRASARGDLEEVTGQGTTSRGDVQKGIRALAKLAQITSAFPGAFAPVAVKTLEDPRAQPTSSARDEGVDARLSVWGALKKGEHFFIDGGVLDNKPFSGALDTIFHRPADRKVCRHLLYLEPNPEQFLKKEERGAECEPLLSKKKKKRVDVQDMPSFSENVAQALVVLPRYESIAEDWERLAKHNATIRRFDSLMRALDEAPAGQQEDASGFPAEGGLSKAYDQARLLGLKEKRVALLNEAHLTSQAQSLEQLRLSHEASPLGKIDVDFYLRRLLALTYELEPRSGPAPESSPLEQSGQDEAPNETPKADANQYTLLWRAINEEIQRVEIFRGAAAKTIQFEAARAAKRTPLELWQAMDRRVEEVLRLEGLEAEYPEDPELHLLEPTKDVRCRHDQLRRLIKEKLDKRLEELFETQSQRASSPSGTSTQEPSSPRPKSPNLLEQSEIRLKKLLTHFQLGEPSVGELSDFVRRFEQQDHLRFPLELASGVYQRDRIRLVRMSPSDAQRGLSKLDEFRDKIAGEQLGHFGAFLKKSWRSNDILWGRLDGISRLCEVLLENTNFSSAKNDSAESDSAEPDSPGAKPELQLDVAKLLRALDEAGAHDEGTDKRRHALGRLFPDLETCIQACSAEELSRNKGSAKRPRDILDELREAIEALSASDSKAAGNTASAEAASAARKNLVDKLILTAQYDALCKELPTVLKDSYTENLAWNQRPSGSEGARRFQAAHESASHGSPIARIWIPLAAHELCRTVLQGKGAQELHRLFSDFALGKERAIDALPPTVLLDLGARGIRLVERAATSDTEPGRRLRLSPAFVVFNSFTQILVVLSSLLRRSPSVRSALGITTIIYCTLAIVTNVLWFSSIYSQEHRLSGLVTFLFLPLSLVVVTWVTWPARGVKCFLRRVLLVLFLIGVGSGAFFLTMRQLHCSTACSGSGGSRSPLDSTHDRTRAS